jgi:arylsulfatase
MTNDRTELHDLAAAKPEKLKEMVALWEEYARRAQVLPWIWRPPYGTSETPDPNQETPPMNDDAAGSNALKFVWKAGDDIPGDRAPRLVSRGFRVTAEVTDAGKNGVLIAQGGSAHGWALYAREGTLVFAMRRSGKLTTVEGPAIARGAVSLEVKPNGEVTVSMGAESKSGRVPGALVKHPQDGLQVGRDTGGRVGDYRDEAAFAGHLGAVTLDVVK